MNGLYVERGSDGIYVATSEVLEYTFLDYKKNVCGRLRLVNKNYLDNKFQPKKDASFHKPDRVQVTREFIVNGYLEELSIRVCDRYLGDCELEFKIKNK